jgi:UDP-glucose 4-epimerase
MIIPDEFARKFRGSYCLVTGGAGFIGSNLATILLELGAQVCVLDNLLTGKRENLPDHPNLQLVEEDLAGYEGLGQLVEGSNYIFHLAAMVGNLKSIEQPELDARTNVMGSVRLYNACRKTSSLVKLVYSSSSAMFGEAASIPIDEGHRQTPESFYALSKMTGEHYAMLAHALWEVPTVCLRYFNVYGMPMERNEYTGVISIFFDRLQEQQALTIYGDGEQYRDFIYVTDILQANLRAAAIGNPGRVFNIGTGNRTTIRSLAEAMIDITGHVVPIEYQGFRPGEVRRSVADIDRARRELHFEPRFGLHAGLDEMWQEIRRDT